MDTQELRPSLEINKPNDVRYGDGQYVSDIPPRTKNSDELSRAFINNPFQGVKFSHYIEVDITDLQVVKGRDGVYVIPNDKSLDLTGRIISYGENMP